MNLIKKNKIMKVINNKINSVFIIFLFFHLSKVASASTVRIERTKM